MSSSSHISNDVRMRGFRERTELAQAIEILQEQILQQPADTVPLMEAVGRVLAEDVKSEVDIPPFNRAAMDGYAVRGEDTFAANPNNPLELELVGESLPGQAFAGEVQKGQAVRIMTGAPIPTGANAVLMAEVAEEVQELVCLTDSVAPGRHVGKIGEDICKGSKILHKGRQLRPQDVAILASIGVIRVDVIRKPVIDMIITGNELLPPGSKLSGCMIIDSNSVLLRALVERDGGSIDVGEIVPDDERAIEMRLLNSKADVLLVSGGSSVGREDYAPLLLAKHGELLVHGIAMRPSSPTGFGKLSDKLVFLLPGNPVSCLAAYDFFVGPYLRWVGGQKWGWPYQSVRLPIAKKIVSSIGRVDYVRVMIVEDKVEPVATSGASILSSTTRADGFVIVPQDYEGYAPGNPVEVYLYDEKSHLTYPKLN